MKAAAFDYIRPRDLDEVFAGLTSRDGAKLLAGGQSLGPMLNLRLARPSLLIDVSRLDSLRQIEDRGDAWRIGAAVTHAELEDAADRLAGAEMLVEVAAGIAYRSVRNRGTIGGSMAHADPAADWPLALAAMGATILVQGAKSVRAVPAERFMLGAFTTALKPDEIITAVEVPKLSRAACYGYLKFCRKTGEYPDASAAAVFDPERSFARIYVGAVAGAPHPLPALAADIAARGSAARTENSVRRAVSEIPHLGAIAQQMQSAILMRTLAQAVP